MATKIGMLDSSLTYSFNKHLFFSFENLLPASVLGTGNMKLNKKLFLPSSFSLADMLSLLQIW